MAEHLNVTHTHSREKADQADKSNDKRHMDILTCTEGKCNLELSECVSDFVVNLHTVLHQRTLVLKTANT